MDTKRHTSSLQALAERGDRAVGDPSPRLRLTCWKGYVRLDWRGRFMQMARTKGLVGIQWGRT